MLCSAIPGNTLERNGTSDGCVNVVTEFAFLRKGWFMQWHYRPLAVETLKRFQASQDHDVFLKCFAKI
jgi:hypothetical protein